MSRFATTQTVETIHEDSTLTVLFLTSEGHGRLRLIGRSPERPWWQEVSSARYSTKQLMKEEVNRLGLPGHITPVLVEWVWT